MQAPLLNAYADQLPKLSAEEALDQAQRVAVGAGSLRRSAARQIVAAWQRQTDRRRYAIRPRSREEYEGHMAIAGIAVKRERRADD